MDHRPFAFSSAHVPLLTQLHERLNEYEDSLEHMSAVCSRFGVKVSPEMGGLERRMKSTSETFDAVLEHVENVDEFVESGYVVLQRTRCGAANKLFSSEHDADDDHDAARLGLVPTSSTILAHSTSLRSAFPPRPSREVLIYSPILAHSSEVRFLSS